MKYYTLFEDLAVGAEVVNNTNLILSILQLDPTGDGTVGGPNLLPRKP